MTRLERLFPAADRELLRAAVARAELETSGEIVPFVVARSDAYAQSVWKGIAVGALAGGIVGAVLHRALGFWGFDPRLWIALPPLAGAVVGLLAARVPPLLRLLAGADLIETRVRQRAEVAFLERELFATRDRSGVLLFVSLFEHRVLVLPDVGAAARVPAARWHAVATEVSSRLAGSLAPGRASAALAAGVERLGALLVEAGFAPVPGASGEANELPDQPALEER